MSSCCCSRTYMIWLSLIYCEYQPKSRNGKCVQLLANHQSQCVHYGTLSFSHHQTQLAFSKSKLQNCSCTWYGIFLGSQLELVCSFNVASTQFAMGRYKPGSTGVDWTGDYTSGVTLYAPSYFSGAIQYIRITISLLHAGSTVFVSWCICAMPR